MNFTEIFIRRPVLATVISLLLVMLGLRAFASLAVREYPRITYPVINVTTKYTGANAELIQGFITRPLERAVASAEGIDYVESKSVDGKSTISAHMHPGYSIEMAFAEISAKVEEQRKELPRETEDPTVSKDTGMGGDALMYLSFISTELTKQQVTDYIDRVVRPQMSTVEGIGAVGVLGERDFAMRIWLDPARMAALNLSAADVGSAIERGNVRSVGGTIRSPQLLYYVNPDSSLHTEEEFRDLVIKRDRDVIVRLRDVARVELGAVTYDSTVRDNGRSVIFLSVFAASSANPLDVANRVKELLPHIRAQLPQGLLAEIIWDVSEGIQQSIREVLMTLLEASVIVIVIIFLFLGSLRSVLIPVVTIPLSLIGVLSVMLWLGFSVNLLTLLAMVLAIGLVVDDAIVVVENIQRHIEEGLTPFKAALQGAREIAFPVISMTLTLAAVYTPIAFLGGLTGALFIEFAFTLAGAVVVSGLVALTLSPMMCSRLLRHDTDATGFAARLERGFQRLKNRYRAILQSTLAHRPVMIVFAATVLVSIVFLFRATQQELAPIEDRGFVFYMGSGPANATIDYTTRFLDQMDKLLVTIPEHNRHFLVSGADNGQNEFYGALNLHSWEKRKRGAQQIGDELQQRFGEITGMRVNRINLSSLPGASADYPVKFVITSTGSYELLAQISEEVAAKARASGVFAYVDLSLKFDKPEIRLDIDRGKAAQLGVEVELIAETLGKFLGENDIGRFSLESHSYKIIPQLEREYRIAPEFLDVYGVTTNSGNMIPMGAVVKRERQNRPSALTEFQQLNSATLGFMLAQDVSMGDAVDWLENNARPMLPAGFDADYVGQSRQFLEEGNVLLVTFGFSFVLIFLVLAAQFESFRDPVTVLISVPLSICGALVPLALGFGSINIYTQVGLLTLIGLISKHGILIVDFANRVREERGLPARDAVIEAAVIRLRPILMTTAAMVFGVMPLLLASGAGAEARVAIGTVITFGMLVGTLFTLFVVPVVYSYVAHRDRVPEARTALA